MIPPRVHPYVLHTWADRELYCIPCIIADGVWHLQPCTKDNPQPCPTCGQPVRWSHGHEVCDCDN